MTIQEAKDKKEIVELKVIELLANFTKETGLSATVETVFQPGYGDQASKYLSKVTVRL